MSGLPQSVKSFSIPRNKLLVNVDYTTLGNHFAIAFIQIYSIHQLEKLQSKKKPGLPEFPFWHDFHFLTAQYRSNEKNNYNDNNERNYYSFNLSSNIPNQQEVFSQVIKETNFGKLYMKSRVSFTVVANLLPTKIKGQKLKPIKNHWWRILRKMNSLISWNWSHLT